MENAKFIAVMEILRKEISDFRRHMQSEIKAYWEEYIEQYETDLELSYILSEQCDIKELTEITDRIHELDCFEADKDSVLPDERALGLGA